MENDRLKSFKEGTFYAFTKASNKIIFKGKARYQPIANYLGKINAKYFLIEHKYVDKDFLEDYINYYSRCFNDYERFCKRVHFFSFDKKKYNNIESLINLKGINIEKAIEELQSCYLGFMVVRPIQNKMIGRTCFKTYVNDHKRERIYYATREYNVNLYGIKLHVESMAFQEQDETVAACASVALWSAIQITGIKYQHSLLSTSEVTKLALSETSFARSFPNNGLNPEQIGVGISKVGLIPLIIRPTSSRDLKSLIYAYLKGGIPVICCMSFYNTKADKTIDSKRSLHAVTINGCSFENGEKDIISDDGFVQYSSRMSKFFTHDDQLCPFSRIEFGNKYVTIDNKLLKPLNTSYKSSLATNENKIAVVDTIILPLYQKIRIQYYDILKILEEFHSEYTNFLNEFSGNKYTNDIEWEIFITDLNSFKTEIVTTKEPILDKAKILMLKYPRFIWRAMARRKGKKTFEILYDATESKNAHPQLEIIYYNNVERILVDLFNNYIK